MPYQVNVFTNWATHATWADLKTWLTSDAGGKLRVVEPRDADFAVVRYVKGQSNFELPHVRWCRSVVVDKASRLPVSVSPPKADQLSEQSLETITSAEEFVDGTMVSVFANGEEAHLATRSRLNATASFYEGGPTFADMLREALGNKGVETLSNVLPTVQEGRVARFTSTVVQHPANRIVRKVDAPNVVVVHQGWTTADGMVFIEEDAANFEYTSTDENADMEIQPYNLEAVRAAKSVEDWISAQAQERGFGWQGVVLKDGQGHRWRVRSQVYETVRRLRGNESTPVERYARLRKARAVDQYLAFYPEDRQVLYDLEGRLRKNTRQLFHFYADVFRARKTAYRELPWPYKHHVSVLHNLYKDKLRAEKKKVDLTETIHYVNSLNYDDTVNMLKQHKLELRPTQTPEEPVVEAAA
jgi:uncharacterized glyoxalase superfamily protein PhnB